MSNPIPAGAPLRKLDRPTSDSRPAGFVRRLKGGEVIEGWSLSSHFHGFFVHFDKRLRRSEGCIGSENECPGCLSYMPIEEKHYLLFTEGKNRLYLEFTRGAANACLAQLAPIVDLRGHKLRVERTRSDNGRVHVALLAGAYPAGSEKLPPDQSPEELLRWLWTQKRF